MATKPKVLYFLGQPRPTAYDQQVAATMDATVVFRDFFDYNLKSTPEDCDGVCGVRIPHIYAGKPTAQAAIDQYTAAVLAERIAAANPTTPAAPAPAATPAATTPTTPAATTPAATPSTTPTASTPDASTTNTAS